jgi:hypothetical protein
MTATCPRQRFNDMRPSQQAGILCNDTRFQDFVAKRQAFPGGAAAYLRGWCNIESRRDLDTDPFAQTKFQTLRTEFDAWTGKIAAQQ